MLLPPTFAKTAATAARGTKPRGFGSASFLEPNGYLSMAANLALRGIVDRLLPIVDASARRLAQALGGDATSRPGCRASIAPRRSASRR